LVTGDIYRRKGQEVMRNFAKTTLRIRVSGVLVSEALSGEERVAEIKERILQREAHVLQRVLRSLSEKSPFVFDDLPEKEQCLYRKSIFLREFNRQALRREEIVVKHNGKVLGDEVSLTDVFGEEASGDANFEVDFEFAAPADESAEIKKVFVGKDGGRED